MTSSSLNTIQKLAKSALEIEAVKFQPDNPFQWASGYFMPIYNDNRRLLAKYEYRELVCNGFCELIESENLKFDVVAGTATAGISPGTTLADRLKLPYIYVRDKAKEHGLKNRIEGVLLPGQSVVVVEDVISTGGSSVRAIKGVREAGGNVVACLSIFSYGFQKASQLFEEEKCPLYSVLEYPELLSVAKANKYLSEAQFQDLQTWQEDPFGWGEPRGFSPTR